MEKILYSAGEGVARITLNRPEKRNALDAEIIRETKEAFRVAGSDSNVRVVLLTGAGKDFCSGADLSALQQAFTNGPLENIADARNMAELFLAMRAHRCPVVAAVRGRALAGGCGLATACDFILADESAQFGYPEVNIGFIPAMVMAILRRSLSEKRALEMIVSGEILSAPAALAAGLVNRVYTSAEFESSVEAYIGKLAAKSASAISLSKHLLYHMDAMGFEAALEAGVQANAIARMTDDCRSGIEKFLSK
jgi:methylglutaconyl-CoA hydratase